jgi:hypothetical protein
MVKVNDQLAENLESQVEMHQVLLEVLNQENRLPASCDLLDLEDIQSVRDTTVKRISELESMRIDIVEDYRQATGLDESITLADILNECEEVLQKSMTHSRDRLSNLIEEIRVIGKQNAEKAQTRIACFDEVQSAVHRSFNRHAVYSMEGVMSKPKGACLLKKSV